MNIIFFFIKNFGIELLAVAILVIMITCPRHKVAQIPPDREQLSNIVRLVQNDHTYCSGTVINDHTIVTAAHCVLIETPFGTILNPGPIDIRSNDNINRGIEATPYYATPQLDHALLRGNFKFFKPRPFITNIQMINSNRPVGKKFISCGYPLGGNMYCSTTYFESLSNFMWKVDGLLLPGMSGGPTMLEDGTVIAVNIAVQDSSSIVSPIYNIIFYMEH